jgi:hypothetical protein
MALAVMAAGVVVVVTEDSTPVANAETVLGVVKDTKVVSSSGSTRTAAAGDRLFRGDVIMTGPQGSAQVITKQRTTFLAGQGALVVVNGARQQLRAGTAVVDALDGPVLDLDLSGAGTLVRIPRGSAVEAVRGASTRVGALEGPAALTSSIGRRLALPELSQVVLSGDAVPGATTPLHLSDSAEEARVVPRLVADDIALKTLARGIDTTGRSTARIVVASWTGITAPVPNRVNRSERVLPVLIADSTRGGSAQQRYNNAVAWRAQGGSWGVVLHLLSGRASEVEATLAALQKQGQSPGQIGTVAPPTVISAAGDNPPTVFQTPPTGADGNNPRGSGPTQPGGSAASAPPDNLLGGLVTTVQSVIDGVLGLLPHEKVKKDSALAKPRDLVTSTRQAVTKPVTKPVTKRSTTAPTRTPTKLPTASPSPTSNGLLGNLLGGLLGKG